MQGDHSARGLEAAVRERRCSKDQPDKDDLFLEPALLPSKP